MCNLSMASKCLEAIERHREELQKEYAGGAALAYWDDEEKCVRIIPSESYDDLAAYQEEKLSKSELSSSILVPLYEADVVCMY